MLCRVFFYQRNFVRISREFLLITGGNRRREKGGFTGASESISVKESWKVVCDFVI